MIVYIDESGVHKGSGVSTFVLAYVEAEDTQIVSDVIMSLEKDLDISSFHWAESTWKVKERFFRKVSALPFRLKIAVVKNPIYPERELERVLSHMLIERHIDKVFIDGKKSKKYERKLKKILRDKGVSLRKLESARDEKYPGLRLADMVAGLARAHFEGRSTERYEPWYRAIEKHIEIVVQ
jgi:hypothetical protein